MSSSRPVGWEQLGDYRLLGRFAEGNSCVLRLAVHRGPEQALRAVKMPRDEFAQDANFTQLLVSEAQLLACIQHPNVVSAHGFGREPGGYVALDYVEGDDFRSLQASGRSLPDPRVVAAIIADVLQGLDAVHDAVGEVGDPLRAVHQAPHARHILVSTDGRARLADFTHARVQRAVSERRRPSRLEAAYRAPEQILTPDQIDARTDLFVLGVAFWEALAGQSLFGASNDAQAAQNVLTAPIRPPGELSGKEHPTLDLVCLRALERDPQARWSSAREMLSALLDAALDLGGIALPAQVGRWVSVQAAAQLQRRRALLGAPLTESVAPAARVQTMPPPAAALDTRQALDLNKPFDRNKTLMGQGLLSQRPAAAAPESSGTVLAETEPAFRPSRPPSSRPPKEGASSDGAGAKLPSPLPAKPSSAPLPATGMTYGDRPSDAIRTEGIEIEREVNPAASASAAPAQAKAATPAAEPRAGRGRITEEYVVTTPRKALVAETTVPISAPPASPSPYAAPSPTRAAPVSAVSAAPPPSASRASAAAPSVDPHVVSMPSADSRRGGGSGPPASSSGPPATSSAPPGGGSKSAPPRNVRADFLRMTLFAVITVVLGDSLIRVWFGSPYGAPRVSPMTSRALTGASP